MVRACVPDDRGQSHQRGIDVRQGYILEAPTRGNEKDLENYCGRRSGAHSETPTDEIRYLEEEVEGYLQWNCDGQAEMASSCPGRGIGGWQWADMPLAMMMMKEFKYFATTRK